MKPAGEWGPAHVQMVLEPARWLTRLPRHWLHRCWPVRVRGRSGWPRRRRFVGTGPAQAAYLPTPPVDPGPWNPGGGGPVAGRNSYVRRRRRLDSQRAHLDHSLRCMLDRRHVYGTCRSAKGIKVQGRGRAARSTRSKRPRPVCTCCRENATPPIRVRRPSPAARR